MDASTRGDDRNINNAILCQFRVTKLRSWRTGYARILVLYEQAFATLDPDTRKETNRWSYSSLVDYMATESQTILIETTDDKLKFSCDDRPEKILLAILQQQDASGQTAQLQRLPLFGDCVRWKRNGMQLSVILQIQSFGITEIDATSRTKLQSYVFSDLSAISFPNDAPDTIVFRFRYPKVILYSCPRRASLVQSIQEQMNRLGLETLPMEPSRGIQDWRRRSLDGVVLSTWSVTKEPSLRRPLSMPRELLVTNKSLVERDTGGMIVSVRTLQSICALVLYDASGLEVEFEHNNTSRKYQVRKHRDALVVSILDVAPWVVVVAKQPTITYRLASKESPNKLFSPVPVASYTLGRVQRLSTHVYAVLSGDFSGNEAPDPQELLEYCQALPESPHGSSLLMACREFNLMERVVEFKLPVLAAVMGIAEAIIKLPETNRARREVYYDYVATLFYTAQRLIRCHPKMAADLTSLRELVPLIFTIENDYCRYNGLLVLEATLTGKRERDLEAEYVNKNVFFQSCGAALVGGLVACLEPGASDLILMVASNILQSILCSHQDTTTPDNFQLTLDRLATRDSALLATLRSPTPYVLENTALLLHLLSQHSVAEEIRESALGSGLVLEHFFKAVFSPLEGQRFLSRYLCSQWLTERLIKRMVPIGFLSYLSMPTISQVEEEQLDALERDSIEGAAVQLEAGAGTNMSRLRSRMASVGIPSKKNFRIFFHVLTQDHQMADLIWNTETRRELRIALESELGLLKCEEDKKIAWNHKQFRLDYPSLEDEVQVGKVYMRLWLQTGDAFIRSWDEPVTIMCIRCLERLYAIHAAKIGPFTDAMIVVRTMSSTKCIEIQHRLLTLLTSVLAAEGIPENAEQLLNVESLSQLCQFVAWGHTNGAQIGNILARALGSQARPMLTSGSDQKPTNEVSSASAHGPGDLGCPPMWFVASTGRSPPPTELIRGPFRVSDLIDMMNRNEISQYDLVTTSHVEDYDGEVAETELQIDTGKWKRLNQVWQLRWQLCTDDQASPLYEPAEVAVLALRALTSLVELHPSTDAHGTPYFPIPIAKRILCGNVRSSNSGDNEIIANPLPIIAQALLCNDGKIIEQAATLIFKLCEHNEKATSKLYLTGFFFFALGFTGNNFSSLAKLLHLTHLRQHFQSGFAATAKESELPIGERSILGSLLPAGMLHILTTYGPDRFAEVFVGNADTPEVIWTFEMRKHLIEMIQQHLGDLPLRLFQNNTMEYEYCPMPGVAYSRLAKELFCHKYYLQNLCDEERFPDWPINEPVELFRDCLGKFTTKEDRDESNEAQELEKARQALKLEEGDGSKELRRAYRHLARKYHPDKNPSGRDMFEKIQKSYERLLPLVESGEKIRLYESDDQIGMSSSESHVSRERKTLGLLIRTQLLVCRRFPQDMAELKYPAYNILLQCISVPDFDEEDLQSNFVKSHVEDQHCTFVSRSVELIFRTCLLSPMNAEGLVEEGGVPTLARLVHIYARIAQVYIDMPADVLRNVVAIKTIADILSNAIHTLAGVAFFESGRSAIKALTNTTEFFIDLKGCMDGSFFRQQSDKSLDASIRRFALEGIPSLAKDPDFQVALVQCGLLWPLIKYTILFDPSMENSSTPNANVEESTTSAATMNSYAKLSVRALGALAGAIDGWPRNDQIMATLVTLLTPPIVKQLRNRRTETILTALNTNVERADMIWNVEMRDHLEGFLDKMEKDRPMNAVNPIEKEFEDVDSFKYKILSEEIQVGGIYIRFFNKGGSSSLAHVENLGDFFLNVLAFIGKSLNHFLKSKNRNHREELVFETCDDDCISQLSSPTSLDGEEFFAVLTAFRSLCQIDGLVEDSLKRGTKFVTSVILSLLEIPLSNQCFDTAGDIIASLSSTQYFADSVVADRTFWRLSWMLEEKEQDESISDGENEEKMSKRKARAWAVLEALTSSPSIANEILKTSVWLELLGVIVGYKSFTKLYSSRLGSAKTLSRLLWDPSTGQLCESLLGKFLPLTLIYLLKDDPAVMITNFDGTADTPELIWDGNMRKELRAVLFPLLDDVMSQRSKSPCLDSFSLKPELYVAYSRLHDELFIGGVYVSRYLKEPSFNLRDPAGFLELLLQRWNKELEQLTSCDPSNTAVPKDTTLTTANKDVLELVTTASIYICRSRDTLCDKLAEWGYMAKCVSLLEKVLMLEMRGSPLLTIMRILHVASGRRDNVESLALVGHSNGRRGIVEFTIESIGKEKLHDECAFMIEFLKKSFELALGDVYPKPSSGKAYVSPSPAPGDGPVRRKVDVGDDPLAMFQASQNEPSPTPQISSMQQRQQVTNSIPVPNQNNQQNNRGFVSTNTSFASRSQAFHMMTSPVTQHQPGGQQNMGYQIQHQPGGQQNMGYQQQSIGYQQQNMGYQQSVGYQQNPSHQFRHPGPNRHQQFPGAAPGSSAEYIQQQIQSNSTQAVGKQLKNSVTNFFRSTNQPSISQNEPQGPRSDLNVARQGPSAVMQHPVSTGQQSSVLGQPQTPISYVGNNSTSNDAQQRFSQSSGAFGNNTNQSYQPVKVPQANMQPTAASQSGINQQHQRGSVQGQQSISSAGTPQNRMYDTASHTQGAVSQSNGYHESYQPGYRNGQAPGNHQYHDTNMVSNGQVGSINNTGMMQPSLPHQSQYPSSSTPQSFGQYPTQSQNPNMHQLPNQQTYLQQQGNPLYSQAQSFNGMNQNMMHASTGNQFGGQSVTQAPVVETVEDELTRQPYVPTAVEGSHVIDARTPEDPRLSAEQLAVSSEGAPGSALGRVAFLQQALVCDICNFLVQGVLENPNLNNVRDSASAKVYSVELVKLLCKDPGYGLKFKMILDEIPAWKKYVSQDHSLLINKKEQKADYFLTNGVEPDTKLLKDE